MLSSQHSLICTEQKGDHSETCQSTRRHSLIYIEVHVITHDNKIKPLTTSVHSSVEQYLCTEALFTQRNCMCAHLNGFESPRGLLWSMRWHPSSLKQGLKSYYWGFAWFILINRERVVFDVSKPWWPGACTRSVIITICWEIFAREINW